VHGSWGFPERSSLLLNGDSIQITAMISVHSLIAIAAQGGGFFIGDLFGFHSGLCGYGQLQANRSLGQALFEIHEVRGHSILLAFIGTRPAYIVRYTQSSIIFQGKLLLTDIHRCARIRAVSDNGAGARNYIWGRDVMKKLLSAVSLACLLAASMAAEDKATMWRYSHQNDPLEGKSFDQFILIGDYIQAPEVNAVQAPRIVIQCDDRKVTRAWLDVGGVVKTSHVETIPFQGTLVESRVEMRWDDKKSPDTFYATISNDHTALFLYKAAGVGQLLTGKRSSKVAAKDLIHSLYLGVVEAAGNKIVMHFDMPADASQLIEKCGLN
jgi:hypothetical protein